MQPSRSARRIRDARTARSKARAYTAALLTLVVAGLAGPGEADDDPPPRIVSMALTPSADMEVGWETGGGAVFYYEIEHKPNGGSWSTVAWTDAATTSLRDPKPEPLRYWNYRLRA